MSSAGQMNIPFLLEEEYVEAGAVSAQWQSLATVWGAFRKEGGKDQIKIRCNPDLEIKVGQRLSYQNNHYLITALSDPLLNKSWMMLGVQKQEFLN